MARTPKGFNILKHANAGKEHREADAETTPLRSPEHYQYDSISPTLPKSGAAAAWWPPGCRSHRDFVSEQPTLERFSGPFLIPAKADGPFLQPSNPPRPLRCSLLRCSSAYVARRRRLAEKSFRHVVSVGGNRKKIRPLRLKRALNRCGETHSFWKSDAQLSALPKCPKKAAPWSWSSSAPAAT